MNAVAQEKTSLDVADHLAHCGVNGHHVLSYEEGWEEASALALVSIARSLEAIVGILDQDESR